MDESDGRLLVCSMATAGAGAAPMPRREGYERTTGVAVVGILFGGTLLSGVLPGGDAEISWDGHLCGLIGGSAVAFFTSGEAGRLRIKT